MRGILAIGGSAGRSSAMAPESAGFPGQPPDGLHRLQVCACP